MKVPPTTVTTVYVLMIQLDDTKIWRRVAVRSDATLHDLHEIVQAVMPWQDCHLHEFAVGSQCYGIPDEDAPWLTNEHDVCLEQLVAVNDVRIEYLYDFGDRWRHTVVVEEMRERSSNEVLPRCLAGERAAPPEDSGGMVRASSSRRSGRSGGPNTFSVEAAGRRLGNLRR